jgi:molybdate transport system substrate-binding protein
LETDSSRKISRRRLLVTGLVAMVLSIAGMPSRAEEPVMIYAAATLRSALDAVTEAARASLHVAVTLVYGPTPSLVQQLENGAAGDILFSADADWMNEAVARGIVDPSTRVDLLSSSLVLIAPATHNEPITITSGFPLAALLNDGRLAMCDPMMMPAGRYGRAALQELGVWNSVKDHIANAADVQTALAYVSRHEAPLGIVFDTDARLDPGVRVIGKFPPDSHPPIIYPLAMIARSRNSDTARVFDFLTSDGARSIFASYGYASPAEAR